MTHKQDSSPTVSRVLEGLRDSILAICHCDLSTDGSYKACVRAALAKNYEVNCLIANHTRPQDAFALTASLRGICEDIICLKYIAERTDTRDEIVELILRRDAFTSMDKQKAFFGVYRPGQPILPSEDMKTSIEECNNKLRELGFPKINVSNMASHTGLSPLYQYIYAATSSYVHFSPYNLMRMGWEKEDVKEVFHYSTSNFNLYYFNFNRIYSVFLFVIFCAKFASIINARRELESAIEELKRLLKEEPRWPELVTSEEIANTAVSPFWYTLLNNLSIERGSELEEFWGWDSDSNNLT